MKIEGTVTEINLEFCKFTLNGNLIVYAGYLFAESNQISFPTLGSHICITEGEKYNNTIFLTAKSHIVSTKFLTDTELCENYIKLIKDNKLNFVNMLDFENSIRKVESVFPIKFLKRFNLPRTFKAKDLVFNAVEQLKTVNVSTPTDHELERGAQEIICNVYWSFGIQSFTKNNYLIGYMTVDPTIGFIMLYDAKYFIVVQIARDICSEYSFKMSQLLNNFVVIQNYRIFTERTSNFPTFHYIFANIRDIHLLLKINKSEIETFKLTKVLLRVIHRCTVSLKNNYLNCWVHCEIKTPNVDKFRECFIILNKNQFAKYPLMNSGDNYVLGSNLTSFKIDMDEFKSKKTYFVNGNKVPVFWIPRDAVLILQNRATNEFVQAISHDFSLISVPETTKVLEICKQTTQKELVNFHGVIKKRRTVSPRRKSPKKSRNKISFGVRGTQVHQIIFKPETVQEVTRERAELIQKQNTQLKVYEGQNLQEAEKMYQENQEAAPPAEEVVLYMHNWDDLQTPLGLIPGMQIAVRNVMNKPGCTYIKPTFLTSFELLDYIPDQDFETAFEFFNNHIWGPTTPLSASHCIPAGCVCWTRTQTLKFTALSVYMRCLTCKDPYYPGQETCCGGGPQNTQFEALFAIKGKDLKGSFDAVCREEEVLRQFLKLNKMNWEVWKKCFMTLKWYRMNPSDFEELQAIHPWVFRTPTQKRFADMVTNTIATFNKNYDHNFDLKCRKLDKTDNVNFNQKWYIIETKHSSLKNQIENSENINYLA